MTDEQKNLLIRCLELTDALPSAEPEKWRQWSHAEWEDEMEFGPRYMISAWFGPVPERIRMRYRRAIDVLEGDGLLTTWRREGTRLTHVGLTPAGREKAEQLGTYGLSITGAVPQVGDGESAGLQDPSDA